MIRNENEFFNRLDRVFSDIELIAQFIRKNVENQYKTERLLTKTEAADILCVSERTLDRYRDEPPSSTASTTINVPPLLSSRRRLKTATRLSRSISPRTSCKPSTKCR